MKLLKSLIAKAAIVGILAAAPTLNSQASYEGLEDVATYVVNINTTIEASVNTVSSYLNNIKDELEQESLKQILAGILTIKDGKVGEIINKFLGTLNWTWIIQEGNLPENMNGKTELTDGGALTTLDYDKLQNATNISVARTMIHEMVHAYITLYFLYEPMNARTDYPEIVNAWAATKGADYNKIQHDEIQRSFIDDIALALDDYGKNAGLNNIDEHVYTDLAWGGLDFPNSEQLSDVDKQRIQYRLSAEQLNKTFGTENPIGTK